MDDTQPDLEPTGGDLLDGLMSGEEAAELLGMTWEALRDQCRKGTGPHHIKLNEGGGRSPYRFRRPWLVQWLQDRQRPARPVTGEPVLAAPEAVAS